MGYQALLFCPDEKTARIVTQVLNDLDFTVEPCTEPFAAVKKLMAQHFDAVVVDCDNEQNATLLFKSARNSSSNQSSLAVAVVEGQAGVAKAFRIGANLVLTKPINVEQAKGTLRVARGLLRKGSDGTKASAPAASVAPTGQVSNAPKAPAAPPRRNVPSAPAARPLTPAASARPSTPAIPAGRPSAAPAMPAMAASTQQLDVDDADGILEPDFEPASPEPTLESKPATSSGTPSTATATATSKFPWQPSPKMAEPMASALRRAAEAAGQMEATENIPAKSPAAPPAPEKRPSAMSGAMFQAQGHAAAPARAVEKPSPAAVAPAIEAAPTVSKPSVREVSEPKAEKPIVDTTRADVPPPTFFPGAYDSDEVEDGGKTKAIVIVAAVVLLACSAGYLSWKNSNNKSAPAAAKQSVSATTTPADAASTKDSAPAAPQTTDITLGPSAPVPAAAAHTTASTKPSAAKEPAPAKESVTAKGSAPAKESEPAAEPEVTQRLIVRSDTGHTSKPAKSQDQENVQAPSAMDVGSAADTKALANISSAPVNVPKPSAQMLRVSQGVMEGLVLKRVQPRYPTQALQMRIQGPVQLQATITKNGDIQNLKVVSGDSVLARAAQEAVRQWKYKPYYLDGEPVQIETQILVNFKLPN
jgi:protein TonB